MEMLFEFYIHIVYAIFYPYLYAVADIENKGSEQKIDKKLKSIEL